MVDEVDIQAVTADATDEAETRPTVDPVDAAPGHGSVPPPPPQMAIDSHYIFKRLRRPMPVPSQMRQHAILGTLMLTMVLLGWIDGSMGPLLPFFQGYYGINYLIMSLFYVTNFVGGMVSGVTYVYITDRIGFGLAAPVGALAQAIGYVMMASGGPYPLFLVASAFCGFGFSIQDAQVNNVTSRLPNASTKMFAVQACFGVGGTIAPLISTAFADHVPRRAYLYFFVAMGIALVTLVTMILTIQGRTEEQVIGTPTRPPNIALQTATKSEAPLGNTEVRPAEISIADSRPVASAPQGTEKEDLSPFRDPAPPNVTLATDPQIAGESELLNQERRKSSGEKMKMILSTRATWMLMMYSFVYVGVEVSLSGWLTSFLVHERGGKASAGYATVGFWGGMTFGRIALIPLTHKLGYQVSIYTYTVIAIVLELVIWFTHSLVGNAVCFALVGMILGPIYPAALMVVPQILDDELRGGVMGLIGTMGGAGAAMTPFVAGAISDRFGIWTLQPLTVALLVLDILLWALVPRPKKKPKSQLATVQD